MLRQQIRDAREEGFTLIELLIVIVVLGILAGIVVFGVGTFRTDANAAACAADIKTISVAADAYNAKTGALPPNVGVLVGAGYLKTTPTAVSAVVIAPAGVTGTCA